MKAQPIIIIVLALVAVVLAVLWLSTNSTQMQLKGQNDSIRTAFEQAIGTINDIQTNIDSIEVGMSGKLLSTEEVPLSGRTGRTQLVGRLHNIRLMIQADKKRITDLEKQLANSNYRFKGIETLVANLRTSLEEKETLLQEFETNIFALRDTLATERIQAQETIAQKEVEIAEQQKIIEIVTQEANTIYYIVGTRKELIEKKIIEREGGFLGIGRISVVQINADLNEFDSFNLLETDSITFPITKKGYDILTAQNSASYTIEKAEDSYVLKVTDKEQFSKNKL
ncbi:MAG: hypothetical protein R6V77_01290, partial [Candidatus Cloacimonadaceae bacterium]